MADDRAAGGTTVRAQARIDDAGGSSGNYLAIPDFPDQTSDFTITGWIRSSDVSRSGQRVFADDETTGGFALSLGDPGSGRIRFYDRGTSPVSLDTPSIITNDTWYFVAAVADITNSQKTIYVYSSAGTLLNTTTGSFTGTWGTDSGMASIGGETNSGETNNRFYGNLDEIRFYQGALGTSQLSTILAETHACAGTPVAHWRFDETSWDGSADEVVDSEGANHGIAASTDPATGMLCNAADFSANGISDYISVDNAALDGATDFTISAWVKTNNNSNQSLVSGSSGSQHNELIMWFTNGSTFTPFLKGSALSNISISSIADDQWHHLVWVRSGSQNCFYRDTALQGCSTGSTSALSIASGGLILGQEQDSLAGSFDPSQDWQGLVDEVLIFHEAVSASQVTSIYTNTVAGNNWDGESRDCPTGVTCTDTFRDNFSVTAYNNNDGDADWAGNWTEIDDDGDPSSGNAFITSGGLYLDDQPDTGGTPGVVREVDLSGYDTATLNMSYGTTSGVDSGDQVSLEISSDGGSNWSTLQNFSGISGATSGNTISLTITSYIASNTQIRLRVTNTYGGSNENFIVEYIEIVAEDTNCTTAVDHYAISHSGLGVTCEAETVTITAHDASEAAVEPGSSVTMTINTGTSVGDWILSSGGGSLANGTANDGIASYTWGAGETAVTLMLQHLATTTAPHMDIDIVDGDSATDNDGDATEDAKLEFRDAAFRFYGANVANNIGNQIAGKESNIAPGNQSIEIRAVQTNTDTGACEARLLNTQVVQMAYQCQNPSTCQGDNKLTIDDATTLRANPASGVTNYSNVSLDFGTNGQAAFTFDYSDVGQVRLHATKIIAASGDDPEVTLNGSSNSFVVRPFAFHVDVPGNPGATGAGGSKFKAAGETFSTTVTAVPWQSADDGDNDGVPDSGADLSNNGSTANFGQESSAETVTISRALVAPSGGANPALADASFSGFSSGAKTNTSLAWSEVGVISFAAALTDNDYLGAGAVIGSVPYVGRFYPDHFSLGSATLTNRSDIGSCSSTFTYMGETFNTQYTLTAENTSNATTSNYAGSFAKLDNVSELNLGAVNSGTDLTSRLAAVAATLTWPAVGNVSAGIGTMDVDLRLNRDTSVDGPFGSLSVGTAPDDGDAQLDSFNLDVDSNGSDEHGLVASTVIRYGRLYVKNAFGPETEDLNVPLQLQYYNGSGFVVNGDDSCTTYIDTDASLDHSSYGSDNLDSGETSITDPTTATAVSAGNSLVATPLVLSAPDEGNEGQVDVIYDAPGWLEFDWLGAGDTDPQGQATFGRYRGHDRIIYWRENFSQ
ncbi:MAG: LamG domain-containing protein [Motiliproteus sp.]|nr:LamG domain-containing protein [Motiliproteus sp.]